MEGKVNGREGEVPIFSYFRENFRENFAKIFVILVIFVRKFSRKAKINFREIFAKIRKRKFSFQPYAQAI